MFCPKCKFDNPLDVKFCNSCGSQMATYQTAMKAKSSKLNWPLIILAIGLLAIYAAYQSRPKELKPLSEQTVPNTSQPVRPDYGPSVIAPVPDLPPAALRDRLENNYRKTVAAANPYLNYIKSQITKMKGGYSLWAVHSMFTQSSFAMGDDAKIVSAWIETNYTDLQKSQIKRVGFKNESGYLGYCYFDVK